MLEDAAALFPDRSERLEARAGQLSRRLERIPDVQARIREHCSAPDA